MGKAYTTNLYFDKFGEIWQVFFMLTEIIVLGLLQSKSM